MSPGYTQPLYILPFDHRSSFSKGLFGWTGKLTSKQTERVREAKSIIYDAFRLALEGGLAAERAGILVDEAFGEDILRDASARGYITAMPLEKSGQEEFFFEHGADYPAHIDEFGPKFCKVLVRYNPEGDAALNERQTQRLSALSAYLRGTRHLLMFELLVPATAEQLRSVENSEVAYDQELRPSLVELTITELQQAGVEPDVWKVEGFNRRADYVRIATAARRDGRDQVGIIVLGRGSNDEQVVEWLRVGSGAPGVIGFAVGRTTFWDPLVSWRDGDATRRQAAQMIADRYMKWVRVFEGRKGG